jgi:tRNA nucleotidyltransferase/poly(A) polymerase
VDNHLHLQEQVERWLAEHGRGAYLVGGCVRDRLLGRAVYDLDVVVATGGLALARLLADRFGGAYYPLDEARGTGRAILRTADGGPLIVDVSELRGPDLDADLADRDFTINALAEDPRAPGAVIDRSHGLDDLRAGLIHPVGPLSILNDPLRALRAVRLAAELGFTLSPATADLIRQDGAGLVRVSEERIRDELSRILLSPRSASSLDQLDGLGLLTIVFPDLEPLRGMEQPAPHYLDGLAHSLETVHALEGIVARLAYPPSVAAETSGDKESGGRGPALPARLTPRLREHLGQRSGDARPRLVALKLAALLHDTGKPSVRGINPEGRVRFIGHEKQSALLVANAMRRLRFAGSEARLGEAIVRHHMRPLLLAGPGPTQAASAACPRGSGKDAGQEVSRRAIYRFFRDTEGAGVDILLHAMADHLATYRPGSGDEAWQRLIELTARMLSDYWERRAERVAPPRLLDGHDLQRELGLPPGRHVGELLEAVREAQVTGEVHSHEEALEWARGLLRQTTDRTED